MIIPNSPPRPSSARRSSLKRRNKSIPGHDGTEIGDNTLRLAVEIQKKHPSKDGRWIFRNLVPMAASCVFYDCILNRRGRALETFDSYYRLSLELMLQTFCDVYWPCSFVDKSSRQCVDTRSSHSPEAHRSSKGKVIGAGSYESNFSAAEYRQEWIQDLTEEIQAIQQDFWELLNERTPSVPYERIASDLHLEQINDFYESIGLAQDYTNHIGCFCCLAGLPYHPLPCGHVLCDACIRTYGVKNLSDTLIHIECCPLHTHTKFLPPWEVALTAEHAGIRVLCLDGGGIRGIIELEVLRAIEKTLGDKIPIQSFFDLIVGTSTGGINALALGAKRWSVKYCASMFESFCDQAFTERELHGVWGLEQAAFLNHGSIYKARPLHHAFQETLGRDPLFGGNVSLNAFRTKVAVTATSGDGKEAVIIANYNRPQEPTDSHMFLRPDDPMKEFEVWEAAAATSAAPFYFKPFLHAKSQEKYIDGGLYHNNPVHVANRERKLLWPHIANDDPDILLSIGTGQCLSDLVKRTSARSSPTPSDLHPDQRDKSPKRHGRLRRTFDTFGALYKRFDNIMDSEQTFHDFEAELHHQHNPYPSPYVRFNLDLKNKPPPFDAKDKLRELRRDTKEQLTDPENVDLVDHIACLLVASSFCFKVSQVAPQSDGSHICTGSFSCKFHEGSPNLRALGEFLRRPGRPGSNPYFVLREYSQTLHASRKVELTESILSKICIYGMFQLPTCTIQVSHPEASIAVALAFGDDHQPHETQQYLLSGFPRLLIRDVSPETRVQIDLKAHRKRREQPSPSQPAPHTRPRHSHDTPSRKPNRRSQDTARGSYIAPPYPHTEPSRIDSGLELPQSLRIGTPPPPLPAQPRPRTTEPIARPKSTPVHQLVRSWIPSAGPSSSGSLPERSSQRLVKEAVKRWEQKDKSRRISAQRAVLQKRRQMSQDERRESDMGGDVRERSYRRQSGRK